MRIDPFSTQLLVEFSAIIDDEPGELKDYLTGISRATLLNATTFLLGFSNRNSEFDSFYELLSMFFRAENNDFANKMNDRLKALQEKRQVPLRIISSYSALQLFEYGFDNLNDEETQTKAESEVNLFKAIILQNQLNTTRQMLAYQSTENLPLPRRIPWLNLSQSLPFSELLNYDLKEVFACQLIKSIFLFEFLESNQTTQAILKKFLEYFEVPDWRAFLKQVIPLTLSSITKKREAHTDIIVEQGPEYEGSVKFIEKMIIQDDEVLADYDFRLIRGRPFFKVKEGVYRVIFDLFNVEILHKGLYFKLNETNKSLTGADKIRDFRSFYTDEFSERYLLYSILSSIYRDVTYKFTGTQIKDTGLDAEPDYYLRKDNSMFLFESKDILINAEIKSSFDFNLHEAEFKKKLYFEDKNGRRANKAVLQLIKNVERALQMEFEFDQQYDPATVTIYPIVVLHDHMYRVAGLNFMVNEWFLAELHQLAQKGLSTTRVRPLTIIDMDTFIYYQDQLRGSTVQLDEVINAYHQYVHMPRRIDYANEREAAQQLQNKSIGFNTFLANFVSDHGLEKVPDMLMEKGKSLF